MQCWRYPLFYPVPETMSFERGERKRKKDSRKYFLGEKWEHVLEESSPREPEQSGHLASSTTPRLSGWDRPHTKKDQLTQLFFPWLLFPALSARLGPHFLGFGLEMLAATMMPSLLRHPLLLTFLAKGWNVSRGLFEEVRINAKENKKKIMKD